MKRWTTLLAAVSFALLIALALCGCDDSMSGVPAGDGSSGTSSTSASTTTSASSSATASPSTSTSPTTSASPSATASSSPTAEDAAAAVKRLAHENSADVEVAEVTNLKMARDSAGRWWATAVAVPVESDRYDSVIVYIYNEGGGWLLFDMGTGIDTSELPEDVRDSL